MAERRGWKVHVAVTGDEGASTKGVADLALKHLDTGATCWAELKAEDGVLSAEQQAIAKAMIGHYRAGGVAYFVWRPSDMPKIKTVLNRPQDYVTKRPVAAPAI